MKTVNHLPTASSPATTGTLVVPEATAPRSAPASIIWFPFGASGELPLPDGFFSSDEIVEEFEKDEEGRRAMAEARQFVAEELYKNQLPQLATYRLAKGWSQKRLAAELGTSQSHVARLETGRLDPQISTVRRLCAVLGISIDEFDRAFDANAKPR